MPAIPELSPTEFRARWPVARYQGDVILLDVREPVELTLAAVEGVLHIPMGEISSRVAELDRNIPLVVMCHGGTRSRRVAEFLAVNGFDRVFNLKGGIDAWSQEIDPRIPRY